MPGGLIALAQSNIFGWDGSSVRFVRTDSLGRIIIAPPGSIAGAVSAVAFGERALAAVTATPTGVEKGVYSEPNVIANSTITLVSASAADDNSPPGTGARRVRVTYFDATLAGPFTEDISLNGTTPVVSANANYCFIERAEVIEVGSLGRNQGTVSMTRAAAPVAIGSIGSTGAATNGDNATSWAHHYIPSGKTCYVTSFVTGSTATVAGNGSSFFLTKKNPALATSPELYIGPQPAVAGIMSSMQYDFETPIVVPGPARIRAYVTSLGAAAITYRASFAYYEI